MATGSSAQVSIPFTEKGASTGGLHKHVAGVLTCFNIRRQESDDDFDSVIPSLQRSKWNVLWPLAGNT